MDEVNLCENGMRVRILKQPSGLRLLVSASESPEPLASFPTNESMLAGVANGYSYQVASADGSLTVSSDKGDVSFRFDGGRAGQKRCRIARHEFERAIHDLHGA